MLFRSTRGAFLDMTFEEAAFEGLAADGGVLAAGKRASVKLYSSECRR